MSGNAQKQPRGQPPPSASHSGPRRMIGWLFGGVVIVGLMLATVAAGAYFALLYSSRTQEITVPDFTGDTADVALQRAEQLGLKLEVAGEKFDGRIASGRILSQEPPAGTETKRGRTVRVIRSLGDVTIPVPDLTGRSVREAQLELERLGLRVGVTTTIRSNEPAGRVIAQQPRESESRGKGDPVNLLVSAGAAARVYVMPDLVGRPASGVVSSLERAGLRTNGQGREHRAGVEAGIVLAQRPAAGEPVRERQVVVLTISN